MYSQDIYDYCKKEESKYTINRAYMTEVQNDINGKMRNILLDWIVDVQVKFKLKDETLFLIVSIIDRFLQKQEVSRLNL